ncbi:uncharacterized protein PHALS_10898 [Plasmopara halstedii]|uniref:Uncharacterized protein n=1 Tax=Plasmopara halstedii TaxID=4781 RepID=A0A0P1AII6_PLAHL|nr:uncharacterized protein PHALS_10898 [Plasmopara halstedii]CEG40714.1 hypothetical protein PHALS_10898 [Plasmopara halstedii]|eukprot:XP_024577083.1 hypothetical protein PHALS_10898 [Plasmopara halstedii]
MAVVDVKHRLSGFKRILLQLDESIRLKCCSHALQEDLQSVLTQVHACASAMEEAKQVEDATSKLHASQSAMVSNEVLMELEKLDEQIESTMNIIVPQSTLRSANENRNQVKKMKLPVVLDAKTLAKEMIVTQDIKVMVNLMQEFEKMMPVINEIEDKRAKWWKKYVAKVLSHTSKLVQTNEKNIKYQLQLSTSLKKIQVKYPELNDPLLNQLEDIVAKQDKEIEKTLASVKSKKRRTIDSSTDGQKVTMNAQTSVQSKQNELKGHETLKKADIALDGTAQNLLSRCSREVRTLREKFELGAYDVNLSRIVTVVDSLWSNMEHADVISLTTALFTLVEIVEKVVNPTKRRDRLVCLESVLGVVLNSSKLHLTARRKTMTEEYASNCRQSIEQLNRLLDSRERPSSQGNRRKTAKANPKSVRPKSHVRFG